MENQTSESGDILDLFNFGTGTDEAEASSPAQPETGTEGASSEAGSTTAEQEGVHTPEDQAGSQGAEPGVVAQESVSGEPGVLDNPGSAPAGGSEGAGVAKPAQEGPNKDKLLGDALETIKGLQAELAQMRKSSVHSSEQEGEPSPGKASKPDIFNADLEQMYQFRVNSKLSNAIFSEESTPEERNEALQQFAKGIAISVHGNIMNSLGKWTKENFDAVPRVVEYLAGLRAQNQQTATSIQESFYKEFPDLQNPNLKPWLKMTIDQVQKETQATAWTPALQTQVGTRLRGFLAELAKNYGGGAIAPNPVQSPAPSPKRAPVLTSPGTRPAPQVKSNDPNAPENIYEALSTNFQEN